MTAAVRAETGSPELRQVLAEINRIERRVRWVVVARRDADPAPDDPYRGLYLTGEAVDRILATPAVPAGPVDPPTPEPGSRLRRLADNFGLGALDVEFLLIALAPDVDARFERLYGYLNDDVTRRRPTVRLALELCGLPAAGPGRFRLGPTAPLVAGGLIEVREPDRPVLTRTLSIPDRVVAHLLGDDEPDPAVRGRATIRQAPDLQPADPMVERVAAATRTGVVYLSGVDADAAELAVTGLALDGRAAIVVDVAALAGTPVPPALIREARLRGGGVVFGPVEALDPRRPERIPVLRELVGAAAETGVPLVLHGAHGWDPSWAARTPLEIRVPRPTVAERTHRWRRALADAARANPTPSPEANPSPEPSPSNVEPSPSNVEPSPSNVEPSLPDVELAPPDLELAPPAPKSAAPPTRSSPRGAEPANSAAEPAAGGAGAVRSVAGSAAGGAGSACSVVGSAAGDGEPVRSVTESAPGGVKSAGAVIDPAPGGADVAAPKGQPVPRGAEAAGPAIESGPRGREPTPYDGELTLRGRELTPHGVASAEPSVAGVGATAPGIELALHGAELAGVVAPLRLTTEQTTRAASAAVAMAALDRRPVGADHVRWAVRGQNGAGLERLARRITPAVGWDDLVLPASTRGQLAELAVRARHRDLVLGEWGMRPGGGRGRGVLALFAGESGTGKTMSAEVVAADLGVELYVVDLSSVVDKYVGETEKNLERIFTEAAHVNGVLLFDEADAVFGKRSQVRDAHDRHANIESAYLLQRMESFDGIAILTTNLRANLDDAFTRRLDVVADFPLPDAAHRRALWDRCLGPTMPRGDDLDLGFCAERFELAGGSIRACAVTAAYLAADTGRPVGMAEVMSAIVREYRKLGRLLLRTEFGRWLDGEGP